MVNENSHTTHIATRYEQANGAPNFRRWLKHCCYLKSSHKMFARQQQEQLANLIEQAEQGHRGEIQLIIEASLPSHIAWRYGTRQRAEQLFAQYGVWDTEENSGVLIYLNLCEKTVELVADRGIHRALADETWQNICQEMLLYFQQGQFFQGLSIAIEKIGAALGAYYAQYPNKPDNNELSNMPHLL